jgi:hypothetical protein
MGPRNKSGGNGKVGACAYVSVYGDKPEGNGKGKPPYPAASSIWFNRSASSKFRQSGEL